MPHKYSWSYPGSPRQHRPTSAGLGGCLNTPPSAPVGVMDAPARSQPVPTSAKSPAKIRIRECAQVDTRWFYWKFDLRRNRKNHHRREADVDVSTAQPGATRTETIWRVGGPRRPVGPGCFLTFLGDRGRTAAIHSRFRRPEVRIVPPGVPDRPICEESAEMRRSGRERCATVLLRAFSFRLSERNSKQFARGRGMKAPAMIQLSKADTAFVQSVLICTLSSSLLTVILYFGVLRVVHEHCCSCPEMTKLGHQQ